MLIYYITLPFTVTSMIALLIIVIVNLRFKQLRLGYPFRLIYILTLIDVLWTAMLIYPSYFINESISCTIQGALNLGLSIAEMLWKSYMSFEIYNVVILNKDKLKFGYNLPLLCIIVFSALISLAIALFYEYNMNGPWCWIKRADEEHPLTNFLVKFFCWDIIITFSIIWHSWAGIKVYKKLKNEFHLEHIKFVNKMKLYPLILAVIYIPIKVYAYLSFFNYELYWLSILANCFFGLNGALNSFVYGFTDEVRLLMRGVFRMNSDYIALMYYQKK